MASLSKACGVWRQAAVLRHTAQTVNAHKLKDGPLQATPVLRLPAKLSVKPCLGRVEHFKQQLCFFRSATSVRSSACNRRNIATRSEVQEGTSHKVVTFYHFTDIEDPHALVEQHREFMKDRDVKGRIYINKQGINAQLSGLGEDAVEYAHWVTTEDPRFSACRYTVVPVTQHKFPRLALRFKPNLVSLEGGTEDLPLTDPSQRAVKLPPDEFTRRIHEAAAAESAGRAPVVLDVRNGYEWDTGHFHGAERPSNERFRDTALDAPGQPLHGLPKDTPVLMYCTGGIRCDVYSAVLRQRGFEELYTLEGGVQAFMKQAQDQGGEEQRAKYWDGELFVFDDRMATPTLEGEAAAAGPRAADRPCFVCREPLAAPPHRNCANVDCNRLFLGCAGCLKQLEGYCTPECRECAVRGRPLLPQPGRYTKWSKYATGQPSARGDGRRRRRAARKDRRTLEDVQGALNAVVSQNLSPSDVDALDTPGQSRYSRRKIRMMRRVARHIAKGRDPSELNIQQMNRDDKLDAARRAGMEHLVPDTDEQLEKKTEGELSQHVG